MTEEQLQVHLVSGEVVNTFCDSYRRPANRIVCSDGFSLSVQASKMHYCTPRNDIGPYTEVEVGFPSIKIEEFMPYAEDWDFPTETVYARVPVEIVLQVINSHGGVLQG